MAGGFDSGINHRGPLNNVHSAVFSLSLLSGNNYKNSLPPIAVFVKKILAAVWSYPKRDAQGKKIISVNF